MMSCVCVTERNVKDEEEIKEGRYLGMMELERRRVCVCEIRGTSTVSSHWIDEFLGTFAFIYSTAHNEFPDFSEVQLEVKKNPEMESHSTMLKSVDS